MYKLKSQYNITYQQKKVVDTISGKFQQGVERQVLLGVTGSGKTFTMANIIQQIGKPALVLSPNKTLAAQLYQEFKSFFPENKVGYFISYYDYYQPEAFIPQRNLYIAKEVSINAELERLRIDAARNLLEARDTIIVASVSAIYSIGSPDDFFNQKLTYSMKGIISRDRLVEDFVSLGYRRSDGFIESGTFRVRGDMIEIFPTSEENPVRFVLDGERIEAIEIFDAIDAEVLGEQGTFSIYPVSYFYHKKERMQRIVARVKKELGARIEYFIEKGKPEYAERIKERTLFDMELLTQYGHCPGIENYSFYLTDRKKGESPYTLLDFFRGDFITIIDESHISVPQLRGMYRGDRSRKETLVNYGFRLPSAMENRPLNFQEVDGKFRQLLYVSATPKDYEIDDSEKQVTDLLVRPTGLLDPPIDIRTSDAPVEDMLHEIRAEVVRKNRVLVTTLTKKMAEKLADFLALKGIRCTYMHSEIKTLDRIKIIKKLRSGDVDVLIGINLLREGLDLPEVSLVVILDADREGFLRSDTSLIQTFGRASRNIDGRVILYLKEMTDSLRRAIKESNRRRRYQIHYNRKHNITPSPITKAIKDFYDDDYWIKKSEENLIGKFKNSKSITKEIAELSGKMKEKASELDFKGAAVLRDRIKELKNLLLEME
jgi:excinuclease ABC subunit B